MKTLFFRRGENIFKEGEIGTETYLIKSGHVAIWRMEGDQQVHLAVKSEGDVVGEMALIDHTERSASVSAESDVEVEIITQEDLDRMLKDIPDNLQAIIRQLMESLRAANDLVSMYVARPPE